MYQSQAPHQLGGEIALLRAERGSSGESDALGPVDRVAVAVRGHKRRVARGLDVLGDLVQYEVPRDALPAGRARGTVLGRLDAARRDRKLHRSRAFRTQAALVDRAVGIALDLKQLDAAVGVLAGVGDQGAADRAVRADGVQLLGAGDPQGLLDLGGVGESDVESEARDRKGPGTRHSRFKEIPTRDCRHRSLPSHSAYEAAT